MLEDLDGVGSDLQEEDGWSSMKQREGMVFPSAFRSPGSHRMPSMLCRPPTCHCPLLQKHFSYSLVTNP